MSFMEIEKYPFIKKGQDRTDVGFIRNIFGIYLSKRDNLGRFNFPI